jgi:hypothetical protein
VKVGVEVGTAVAVEVEVGVGVDQERASTCLISRGVTLTEAASSALANQAARPEPNKREKSKAQRPAIKTPAITIRGSLDRFRLKTIHSKKISADYTTAQLVQPIQFILAKQPPHVIIMDFYMSWGGKWIVCDISSDLGGVEDGCKITAGLQY